MAGSGSAQGTYSDMQINGSQKTGDVFMFMTGNKQATKQRNDCCGTGNAVIMGLQGKRVTWVSVEES